MNSMTLCPICLFTISTGAPHTCPPAWKVRLADDVDTSAITIFAATATDAAEDFCDTVDSEWEYPIANSGGIDLIVIAPDGEEIPILIEVRATYTYTATEKRTQPCKT